MKQSVLVLVFLAALSPLSKAADPGAAAKPRIFWASAPVRPDETVMLQGSDLGPASTVEMTRLDDAPAGQQPDPSAKADVQIGQAQRWMRVPVLQESDESLKFVVPADWKAGIFACRVTHGGITSDPVLLNEPDPWWIQGDEGETATPGGWLRVLGKSLAGSMPGDSGHSMLSLDGEHGSLILLHPTTGDGYSLRFDLPHDLPLGKYSVRVHNGNGAAAGWKTAGRLQIIAEPATPVAIYNVLDSYGPDATREMRKSLSKYAQPIDRTEGILAALKKAKESGGGTVYFPAGRYTVKGAIVVPDHTLLKGEGMGVVTLWWGTGAFNMDGGGSQERTRVEAPKPPDVLIFGRDFAISDMSIYLPINYEQAIVADKRFRMNRVRVRVDRAWFLQGRGGGAVARMGENFQVTDCDIFAKGIGLTSGRYGLISNNKISSMHANTPLGQGWGLIVEHNQFIGMDPTAYQNIAGCGRNIYYAHNRQESLFVHQADYSFTFDASAGAYLGAIAEAHGKQITLVQDPVYPKWAAENSSLWRRSVICILSGRGAGQWRDVIANHGRNWEIDRPFDTPPDSKSVATIVPFSGRVLVIGNRFEDAAWVNAGYGTSIDVVCAENEVVRSASLMNFGVHAEDWYEPSWYVQYFDNRVTEGQTSIESSSGGGSQKSDPYTGPLTGWAVHRRQTLAADNGGSLSVSGNIRDVIVEGCTLNNPMSAIRVVGTASGVVLRNNHFAGAPAERYEGEALKNAVVVPTPGAK